MEELVKLVSKEYQEDPTETKHMEIMALAVKLFGCIRAKTALFQHGQVISSLKKPYFLTLIPP